jgi:phage gp29-like protein
MRGWLRWRRTEHKEQKMAVKPKQRIEPQLRAPVDQDGNAADQALLRAEISAPSSFAARPPFEGNLAFGMSPQRLGAILRAADNANTRDWMILAEEIEELFTHYSSVLGKRKRQVCGLPMTVNASEKAPDGERHADFVREWLDMKVLSSAMFNITDAIGKGYCVSEIMWETTPQAFRPAEIRYRKPSYFELSWEDGETLWLRTERGFDTLAPHKFLTHVHRSKSGGPARSSLTRMVAFIWMYSSYTLKDWALFTQAYGMPIRVGKYGPEASDADKRVLWRAVSSIAGDVSAIIPTSMQMEFVERKGNEGKEIYLGRANWLNYEVSKLVLGSTASTDAISGGHAVGKEHRDVEQDVEDFDTQLIAGSINRQVVQAMIAFTFGPQPGYPELVIGTPKTVPLADIITGVAAGMPYGLRIKADEYRERLQFTKPDDGDEILQAPAADADKPPAPPAPVTNPNGGGMAGMSFLNRFLTLHSTQVLPELDALEERLRREAAGALAGLTDEVRAEFEAAHSMQDLATRLQKLKLDDTAFGDAMSRGMALAHLVGQAAVLDDIVPMARRGG